MCIQMKGLTLLQREMITKNENTLTKFKNRLFQNQVTNFDQTKHKASMGEGYVLKFIQ